MFTANEINISSTQKLLSHGSPLPTMTMQTVVLHVMPGSTCHLQPIASSADEQQGSSPFICLKFQPDGPRREPTASQLMRLRFTALAEERKAFRPKKKFVNELPKPLQ